MIRACLRACLAGGSLWSSCMHLFSRRNLVTSTRALRCCGRHLPPAPTDWCRSSQHGGLCCCPHVTTGTRSVVTMVVGTRWCSRQRLVSCSMLLALSPLDSRWRSYPRNRNSNGARKYVCACWPGTMASFTGRAGAKAESRERACGACDEGDRLRIRGCRVRARLLMGLRRHPRASASQGMHTAAR